MISEDIISQNVPATSKSLEDSKHYGWSEAGTKIGTLRMQQAHLITRLIGCGKPVTDWQIKSAESAWSPYHLQLNNAAAHRASDSKVVPNLAQL